MYKLHRAIRSNNEKIDLSYEGATLLLLSSSSFLYFFLRGTVYSFLRESILFVILGIEMLLDQFSQPFI